MMRKKIWIVIEKNEFAPLFSEAGNNSFTMSPSLYAYQIWKT
jgi:hypothetical protein